jgi:hypothetical protein
MRLKKRVQQSNRRRAPALRHSPPHRSLPFPAAALCATIRNRRLASCGESDLREFFHRATPYPSDRPSGQKPPMLFLPFTMLSVHAASHSFFTSLQQMSRTLAAFAAVSPLPLVGDSWCTRLYTLFRRSPCHARRPALARHTIPAGAIPGKNVFVTFLPFYCFHETGRSVRASCSIVFLSITS